MKTSMTQNLSESWHVPAKQFITNILQRKAQMLIRLYDCLSDLSSRKLLSYVSASAIVLALSAQLASATIIYMDSGTSGSYISDQSYNETRAVDVTVLSPLNLTVSSMTLSGIAGSGLAEAVIYDSNTQSLIASAQGNLTGGTITLSISATLVSGDEYRIGFYGQLDDGTFFIPGSPPYTLPGDFPYTESSGLLQVNGAWDFPADSFPTYENLAVPLVSMQVIQVPEPGSTVFWGIGLFSALCFRRRWAK
jgi:hypothetical protein